ncbi:polymer-forming cytoskeletal protein [Microvenator marinus]|jgi:cytoskeletal protein CcmA (bactofilin family)|uniref:Polymer-forming cytoskeletal protein n=1 Tax=Microvenator marinus TaxID=2600177 RepID=A0A5B8XR47_9DELT|nr:polymer-forming cytoskeletal protein [Microvenator marinus]QED26523.1 polymer-forming cytoskeletal protein [Microvenator marinus]
MAMIGEGILIKGRISGSVDLTVAGNVEGQISLDSELTITESGQVVADVDAHRVHIHGHYSGNLVAQDLIHLNANAKVTGNLRAPRIVLDEGARFKGNIDMDVPA